MKNRVSIFVSFILTVLLLTGCSSKPSVDSSWWEDKTFYNSDNGVTLYTDYQNDTLFVDMEKSNIRITMAQWDIDDYSTDDDAIFYISPDDGVRGTIFSIAYIPDSDTITVVDVYSDTGSYSMLTGVYTLSSSTELEDYSFLGNFYCFETETKVTVELQNGMLVLYFPEADIYIFERNGADTGWETNTGSSYTSAYLEDNNLIISSTSYWQYDGTYIQMPDTSEE